MMEPIPQALHYSWLMRFAAVFQLWVPNKTSLQGHWCAWSAITFVIVCSLFSPDRTHQTAHQDPTPQPAAVASNSISSRIKHAPPSPILWKTSLQGWVWLFGVSCPLPGFKPTPSCHCVLSGSLSFLHPRQRKDSYRSVPVMCLPPLAPCYFCVTVSQRIWFDPHLPVRLQSNSFAEAFRQPKIPAAICYCFTLKLLTGFILSSQKSNYLSMLAEKKNK